MWDQLQTAVSSSDSLLVQKLTGTDLTAVTAAVVVVHGQLREFSCELVNNRGSYSAQSAKDAKGCSYLAMKIKREMRDRIVPDN